MTDLIIPAIAVVVIVGCIAVTYWLENRWEDWPGGFDD